MISEPTTDVLIEIVREELRATVAPAVNDASAAAVLGMIDAVLRSAAARHRIERSVMREELDMIGAVVNIPIGTTAANLREEYACAGEALSQALDGAGPALRDVIDQLLAVRVHNEVRTLADAPLEGRG